MIDLEKAIVLATKAHKGQKRCNGEPYILHPLRIMMKMGNDKERIVAILHDVFEDSDEDIHSINMNEDVKKVLILLTKNKDENYIDYIKAIKKSNNPLLMKVKLADIRDNFYRLDKVKNQDFRNKLFNKYDKALKILIDEDVVYGKLGAGLGKDEPHEIKIGE